MISITEWQSECRGLGCAAGGAGLGRGRGVRPLPAWPPVGTCKVTSGASGGSCHVGLPQAAGPGPLGPLLSGRRCSGLPGSQRLLPGGAGRLTTLIPSPFRVLKPGVLPGWTWEASAYSDSSPNPKLLKSPVALAPSDQKLNSNPLPKSP